MNDAGESGPEEGGRSLRVLNLEQLRPRGHGKRGQWQRRRKLQRGTFDDPNGRFRREKREGEMLESAVPMVRRTVVVTFGVVVTVVRMRMVADSECVGQRREIDPTALRIPEGVEVDVCGTRVGVANAAVAVRRPRRSVGVVRRVIDQVGERTDRARQQIQRSQHHAAGTACRRVVRRDAGGRLVHWQGQ